MKTQTTMKLGVVARAVEGEGEREKETYARPVQEENALMESEAFSGGVGPHFVGDKIDKISKLQEKLATQERHGFIHVKSFVRSAVRSHGDKSHGARAYRDSDDEHRIFSSAWVTHTKGKSAALFRCGECPAEFFK